MSNAPHLRVVQSDDDSRNEYRMHGHYKPENRPLEDPVSQQGIMRQFFREWRLHIPLAERDLLGWLLDRTSNWGKDSRRITYWEIAEANGPQETQARTLLKALEARGCIKVTRFVGDTRGMLIEPNLEWEPTGQRPAARKTTTKRKILTTVAIDRELHRAHEIYGDGVRWPDKERHAVAQSVVANCLRVKMDVETAHHFADWLASAWPYLAKDHGAPGGYPEVDYINSRSQWLFDAFQSTVERSRIPAPHDIPTENRGAFKKNLSEQASEEFSRLGEPVVAGSRRDDPIADSISFSAPFRMRTRPALPAKEPNPPVAPAPLPSPET